MGFASVDGWHDGQQQSKCWRFKHWRIKHCVMAHLCNRAASQNFMPEPSALYACCRLSNICWFGSFAVWLASVLLCCEATGAASSLLNPFVFSAPCKTTVRRHPEEVIAMCTKGLTLLVSPSASHLYLCSCMDLSD